MKLTAATISLLASLASAERAHRDVIFNRWRSDGWGNITDPDATLTVQNLDYHIIDGDIDYHCELALGDVGDDIPTDSYDGWCEIVGGDPITDWLYTIDNILGASDGNAGVGYVTLYKLHEKDGLWKTGGGDIPLTYTTEDLGEEGVRYSVESTADGHITIWSSL